MSIPCRWVYYVDEYYGITAADSKLVLLCRFFHKPPANPPGKAPVDVLKEQMLLLPVFPGDGFGLHISCGIKVGRDFDIDPFRVRCRNGSHGRLPPFLQCVILLPSVPSVSVYSL